MASALLAGLRGIALAAVVAAIFAAPVAAAPAPAGSDAGANDERPVLQATEQICGGVEYVWDANYEHSDGLKISGNLLTGLSDAERATLQLAPAGYSGNFACVSAVLLSPSEVDVQQASIQTCVEVQELYASHAVLSTGIVIPFSANSTVTITATPGRAQPISSTATGADVTLTPASSDLCPPGMGGAPPPGPSQYDNSTPAPPAPAPPAPDPVAPAAGSPTGAEGGNAVEAPQPEADEASATADSERSIATPTKRDAGASGGRTAATTETLAAKDEHDGAAVSPAGAQAVPLGFRWSPADAAFAGARGLWNVGTSAPLPSLAVVAMSVVIALAVGFSLGRLHRRPR